MATNVYIPSVKETDAEREARRALHREQLRGAIALSAGQLRVLRRAQQKAAASHTAA